MAIKVNLYALGILSLLATQNYSYSMNAFVAGGPNYTTLNHQDHVQINEEVINAYQASHKKNWEGFWGVGANYTYLPKDFSDYQFSLGVAGFFFDLGHVKGVELPFINEGVFDALHYQFQAKSATTFAEAQLAYSAFKLSPFALVGLGASWNRLSNYKESAINPELSAAPAALFKERSKQNFAYELGAGVQYLLFTHTKTSFQSTASVSYHYFNLGKAALGKAFTQDPSNSLKIKNLSTQGVVFSLIFSV